MSSSSTLKQCEIRGTKWVHVVIDVLATAITSYPSSDPPFSLKATGFAVKRLLDNG